MSGHTSGQRTGTRAAGFGTGDTGAPGRPVGIGIISFEHVHAPAYVEAVKRLPGARLVGIADEDPYRGSQAARRHGTAHFTTTDELLALPDVDAVIVNSANARHRQHVLKAVAAGKHVLCEKPLATTLEDATAMVQAARQAGVVLQTAFPVRHNAPTRQLKRWIDEGELGRICAVNATNHGVMPPGWFQDPQLAGGGAVMDHTVHVVDLLRWMLRSEVRRVYAEAGTLLHPVGVEDAGILILELENGCVASLDCSWSRPSSFVTWGDVTMEVVGDQGVAHLDAFSQAGLVYGSGQPAPVRYQPWGNDADQEMIAQFLAEVRGQRSEGASGEDGLKALEVALAAYESARLRRPVELPLG